MPVIRADSHPQGFTVVDNGFLHDGRLSMAARGLLVTMLSLAPGWEFSARGLASIMPDGRKAIENHLKELEACGYVVRPSERKRGQDGRYLVEEWTISETPIKPQVNAMAPKGTMDATRENDAVSSESPCERHGSISTHGEGTELNTEQLKVAGEEEGQGEGGAVPPMLCCPVCGSVRVKRWGGGFLCLEFECNNRWEA